MISVDQWTVRLSLLAPHTQLPLLRVLATLIAGDEGAGARDPELMLAVAEQLALSAREARAYGHHPTAHDLAALADELRRQVAWRSPTLGLPRRT